MRGPAPQTVQTAGVGSDVKGLEAPYPTQMNAGELWIAILLTGGAANKTLYGKPRPPLGPRVFLGIT